MLGFEGERPIMFSALSQPWIMRADAQIEPCISRILRNVDGPVAVARNRLPRNDRILCLVPRHGIDTTLPRDLKL